MSELRYRLKGLNCAHCAAKIQENIGELDEVDRAEIIFATQNLNVRVKSEIQAEELLENIKNIVSRIKPDVEVMVPGQESPENSTSVRKEFLILALGGILFIAGMLVQFPFRIELAVYGFVYLLVGWDVLLKAFKNIIRGQVFDENFLMSIATLGALAIGEYPEASAVMLFYKTGELFQNIAVNKSRKSIRSLIDLRPDYANLQTDDGLARVNPEDVRIGDVIVVKSGERVPLDGTVLEGSSFLDTSALTGEAAPRSVVTGDGILSGSVNKNGLLTVKVTKSLRQSTVSRILDLVQNAASKKAYTENFITKFARYYTPFVVLAALLIAVLPPVISGTYAFAGWIYRALVFLVISCPCALVISIPLSFFGGIGGASRKGILVKGGNYLEALNNIDTVVFDKTGTLTKGVFKVSEVVVENGYSEKELLELAALAEAHSSHPIAKSILEAYGEKIDEIKVESYEDIPGYGIKAVISGRTILAGNDRLLHIGDCIEHNTCHVQGTVIHIAVDNLYAGYILISDEIKEDSAKAIAGLRELGIKNIAMLTGDSRQAAENIGRRLGLDAVYPDLLPHQKVEKVEVLQKNSKGKILFVGDGINDAPVLARADVGAAMGALGSDAAIEASDIVLMTDEPSKIAEAIRVARKTRSIVLQNIIFSMGIKLLVLLLGAGGIATMWEAVFADVGVTLVAVLNALRVMKK